MATTVTVLGLAQLDAKLAGMAAAVAGPAMTAALMSAAKVLETAAKENAPVLTGNLRRSIHTEQLTATSAAVGTDVVYARRIEYGFSGPDSLGRVYHQPPQPYMRPAVDEHGDEAGEAAMSAAQVIIDAAADI